MSDGGDWERWEEELEPDGLLRVTLASADRTLLSLLDLEQELLKQQVLTKAEVSYTYNYAVGIKAEVMTWWSKELLLAPADFQATLRRLIADILKTLDRVMALLKPSPPPSPSQGE